MYRLSIKLLGIPLLFSIMAILQGCSDFNLFQWEDPSVQYYLDLSVEEYIYSLDRDSVISELTSDSAKREKIENTFRTTIQNSKGSERIINYMALISTISKATSLNKVVNEQKFIIDRRITSKEVGTEARDILDSLLNNIEHSDSNVEEVLTYAVEVNEALKELGDYLEASNGNYPNVFDDKGGDYVVPVILAGALAAVVNNVDTGSTQAEKITATKNFLLDENSTTTFSPGSVKTIIFGNSNDRNGAYNLMSAAGLSSVAN